MIHAIIENSMLTKTTPPDSAGYGFPGGNTLSFVNRVSDHSVAKFLNDDQIERRSIRVRSGIKKQPSLCYEMEKAAVLAENSDHFVNVKWNVAGGLLLTFTLASYLPIASQTLFPKWVVFRLFPETCMRATGNVIQSLFFGESSR